MTFGSLFSGVGGIDLGLERAGMVCKWQVEKDMNCNKVLEKHWPDVKRFNDVQQFRRANTVELICGGFPCQDLSVAGKRAGLAGMRSRLFHEFMRIADEHAPRWILLENVPGLLSSNKGRDMGTVVGSLGDRGYGWAYRVLDSQYFGLAQRRKRVFIVGHIGDARRAAKVLFEPESMPWDSPSRQEKRENVAGSITGRIDRGGVNSEGGDNHLISSTLNGHHGRIDGESETFVADNYAKGAGHNDGKKGSPQNIIVSPTLPASEGGASSGMHPVIAATLRSRQSDFYSGETHATLDSHNGSRRHQGVIQKSGMRRLTPKECERLQGFPDSWTQFDKNGKTISDSARYRMLGNAVSVPVAEWIGRRIMNSGDIYG